MTNCPQKNLLITKENQKIFNFLSHLYKTSKKYAFILLSGSLCNLNSISPSDLDSNPAELINVYTLGVSFINYSST